MFPVLLSGLSSRTYSYYPCDRYGELVSGTGQLRLWLSLSRHREQLDHPLLWGG